MLGNFARRISQPQTSEDLAARLSWGNPVEIAAVEARLMGTAPVCLNGGKWMAVDEHGRGFLVHVEDVSGGMGSFAITLHVFDVTHPAQLTIAHHIAPTNGARTLAAPCIAISSGPIETRFVVAFLGQPLGGGRFGSIYIAAGTLSPPRAGRMTSPVLRVYNVLELQPPYEDISEPSVFMDNADHVHLVYTARTANAQPTVIAYSRAEWLGDPNTWRWTGRALGGLGYDMRNPSVAARWQDGQLVVVAACKVRQPTSVGELSDVYQNTATGRGRLQNWRGWEFLSGVDLLSGNRPMPENDNSCGDPSAWVAGDGQFCIGYHERTPNLTGTPVFPCITTNASPERASSSWVRHVMDPDHTNSLDNFVCVSSDGEQGVCVWESRDGPLGDPARWATGVAILSDSTSSDWALSDPTNSWGINLDPISGQEMLVFPTCYMAHSKFFVAWLYVDRSQDGSTAGGPLDSPLTWPSAPVGAVVSLQFLVGVL